MHNTPNHTGIMHKDTSKCILQDYWTWKTPFKIKNLLLFVMLVNNSHLIKHIANNPIQHTSFELDTHLTTKLSDSIEVATMCCNQPNG